MQIHIVRKGDTLWKISRSYGVSFEELKKLNAHLANPEYIVPGMKIFIPETKKMESMTHPYSEHRPVKKDMMKEEVKTQPATPTQPKQIVKPPKAQPMPIPGPVPVQPMPQIQPMQPVKPMPQVQPMQPMQPQIHFHMMPVPDLDMTPSPQGWRLIESTSIDIHITKEEPKPQPVPPKPVQPQMPPVAEEPSSMMPPMFECPPPMQQFPIMMPCMPCIPCPCSWMHPHMHPHMPPQMHPCSCNQPQMQPYMHPHMQNHGGCPFCHFPGFPSPPPPHQSY